MYTVNIRFQFSYWQVKEISWAVWWIHSVYIYWMSAVCQTQYLAFGIQCYKKPLPLGDSVEMLTYSTYRELCHFKDNLPLVLWTLKTSGYERNFLFSKGNMQNLRHKIGVFICVRITDADSGIWHQMKRRVFSMWIESMHCHSHV